MPNSAQPRSDELFAECVVACARSLSKLSAANLVELMIQTGCAHPFDRENLMEQSTKGLIMQYCRDCECAEYFAYSLDDEPKDGTEQPSAVLKPRT